MDADRRRSGKSLDMEREEQCGNQNSIRPWQRALATSTSSGIEYRMHEEETM
jgi:hypothetical protein